MPEREIFRTDYPEGEPHLLSGDILNRYGRALNSIGRGMGGSGLNYSGISGQSSLPPDLMLALARVTDNSNSGGLIAGTDERDAPAGDVHKYSVNIRFFNHDDILWQTHDTGVTRMDAGGFHGGIAGQGAIPRYKVGDVVPVWFDAQRNWCIPIHSPPEQVGSAIFRSQNSTTPRSVRSAVYIDTVQVNLEVRRGQQWFKYYPELVLRPGGQVYSGASGSVPMIVAIRHQDEFRITCGKNRFSSAALRVWECGFRFTLLGRLGSDATSGLGEMTGANKNFTAIEGLQQIGNSMLRFADEPTYTAISNTVRVDMKDPFTQWLVAVDMWAEVDCSGAPGVFIKVDYPGQTAGHLMQPQDSGTRFGTLHKARIMAPNQGGGLSEHLRCYLKFIDYLGDAGDVIAEQGRVYGPCQMHDIAAGAGDPVSVQNEESLEEPDRPVYFCTIGEQEYLAKTQSAGSPVAKGASGTFVLYNSDESSSGITKTAKAIANEVPPNKWALVKRLNRTWFASQWEC
jgi:hypothetical protein